MITVWVRWFVTVAGLGLFIYFPDFDVAEGETAESADAQQRALTHYRQGRMSPIHHLTAPPQAHGPDLSYKKSRSAFSWPNLLVELGDQGPIALLALAVAPAEDTGRSLQQGLLPGLDLTRVNLIPGGQLGHLLLSLHRRQGHLGFKTPGYASSVAPCPTPSQQLPLPLV